MALTNSQILTRIGMTVAAARTAVINDLLIGGLEGLAQMSDEDVKDACASYAKRTDGVFPVILPQLQRQRLRSLALWVKDRIRAQANVGFENTTTAEELNQLLADALNREKMRKEQRKVGESHHDHSFNNKLKTQTQWETFSEELDSTLNLIIGSRGIPLTYVIRQEAIATFDENIPYEEAVIQAAALDGPEFKVDARTVHQIILNNVDENGDAYTYIKSLLRRKDGRQDILALRDRYSSDASKQGIINAAKVVLDNLRYKNERNFSFEKFSSKLQKAYDELEEHGRAVHNGDIVDALWDRIVDSSLTSYISSLKVDYQRTPRSYKLILQDISAEVANNKKAVSFAPGTRGVSAAHTREGTCPTEGVYTSDGSLFIGNYSDGRWHSDSVKPFHKEILEARKKAGGGKSTAPTRADKRRTNAVKRNKRKLKRVSSQISKMKVTIAKLTKDGGDDGDASESESDQDSNHAGESFGGKNAAKKAKKKRE